MKNRIGKGSFGEVYECENRKNRENYAIKFEKKNSEHQPLFTEIAIYKKLACHAEVANVHWTGQFGDHETMVMDLLGTSLADHVAKRKGGLSLKSVLMIADQMIKRVELLHQYGYIHRDIKPENFVFGRDSHTDTLFLIDYGLAKKYRDEKNQHVVFRQGVPTVGTMRYVSINTHLGLEQGRRDDMESIGYVLIFLMRGALPWQGITAANGSEKCAKIAERKIGTPTDSLCAGLPCEFAAYMKEVKALKFQDEPEYAKYRKMFSDLMARNGFVNDSVYEWTPVKKLSVGRAPSNTPIEFLSAMERKKAAMFQPIRIENKNRCRTQNRPGNLIMKPEIIDLRSLMNRTIRCNKYNA